ncbi:hypothetical protein NBO_460g0002 [Nosema bombycis CQ1]|uniref:Uncharacterized protein n=1 Tax=Nosema bombycis (strain CQ1 / CVCC 102059) TaxID=578461 RepID=R0M2V8_NOSB1|nr:hypothetical protein NBO_460g0002 [Nosema bombycis CQ1]|eukprot:EOB12344.1 hypothetical protein NBO_460g0002 [Nosema bombycis CQ1]
MFLYFCIPKSWRLYYTVFLGLLILCAVSIGGTAYYVIKNAKFNIMTGKNNHELTITNNSEISTEITEITYIQNIKGDEKLMYNTTDDQDFPVILKPKGKFKYKIPKTNTTKVFVKYKILFMNFKMPIEIK